VTGASVTRTRGRARFRIVVARSLSDVDTGDWTRVVREAGAPVFYGVDYLRSYESHPLGSFAGAVYLTAYLGDRPVAVLPLFLQPEPDPLHLLPPDRLSGPGLLGHVWYCYDTHIPVVLDDPYEVCAALLETVEDLRADLGAAVCGLINVAADNPVLDVARKLGWATPEVDARYRISLAGYTDFADYLATLNHGARHNMRRHLRRAADAGATATVVPTDPGTLVKICDLIRHTAGRFGNASLYSPETFVPFVRGLGDSATAIRVDGPDGMLAGAVALLDDAHLHLWVGGFERETVNGFSPYYLLWATAIGETMARGLPTLEVGRRNDEFKQRHGAARTALHLCLPPEAARRSRFPLSWQQRRAFVQGRRYGLSAAELGGGTFLASGAYRLTGRIDPVLLARAVRAVVARHDALRTTFDMSGDEPEAVTHDEMPVPVDVIDVADEQELTARIRAAVADEPFDLGTGPLLRVRLLRVAPDEAVLIITTHHIVSDGWSFGVFLGELAQCYNAYRRDETPDLRDLPMRYGDYAIWQGEQPTEHQLASWRERLRGLAPLDLPTDRPRGKVANRRAEHVTVELPAPLCVSLRALGRAHRATLHMVLTSGLAAFLAGLTGSRDITIGTPVANRHPTETESVIGVFTNTLILRIDLSEARCFRDVLHAVRRTAIEAYRNPDVPPEALVDSADVPVRVVFAMRNSLMSPPQFDGATAREYTLPDHVIKYDLLLSVDEYAGALRGYLEYRTALFDAATVQRFAGAWRDLLAEAARDPSRPIAEVLRHGAAVRPGAGDGPDMCP
jgi:predicted N-acyltransferase